MRCAECGDKITGKPIKRRGRTFCSIECAETATEERYDEDEDRGFDDEFETLDQDEIGFEGDSEEPYYESEDDR